MRIFCWEPSPVDLVVPCSAEPLQEYQIGFYGVMGVDAMFCAEYGGEGGFILNQDVYWPCMFCGVFCKCGNGSNDPSQSQLVVIAELHVFSGLFWCFIGHDADDVI